jgi:REP element-mobilizing transposase RayT
MARTPRIKAAGEEVYYHVVSRTVGGEFYLGDVEKERFVEGLRRLGKLFFVDLAGFCVMSNHFHLVVRTRRPEEHSDREIVERLAAFYGLSEEVAAAQDLGRWRRRLFDLSEYVKAVKVDFSRWYNRKRTRRGYFWGDRFKSVVLEGGRAVLQCLAYIELNPVRARITDRPEKYRWSSLSFRLAGKDDFLLGEVLQGQDAAWYWAVVTEVGKEGRTDGRGREKGRIEPGVVPGAVDLWRHRVRFFSDSLVLGSKGFVQEMYARFSECIGKRERRAHRAGGLEGLYGLRRLAAGGAVGG